MFQKTPVWYLGFVSVIGFALFFFATYLAYDQPSLGISLRVDEQGSVRLHKNGTGPASGLEKGWSLEQISGDAGQHPISEQTLIEEPDVLGTKAKMRAFFNDQDELWRVLMQGPVTVSGQSPTGAWEAKIQARETRPLWEIPSTFWVHLLSGLVATLIAGWVWALNPKGTPQLGLLISGIGLQLSASMAAIYSSRELALPQDLFSTFSTFNLIGTQTFGVGLVMVFLAYPKPYLRGWLIWLPMICVGIFHLVAYVMGLESLDIIAYLPILLLLIAILALIAAQFISARKDLVARASLQVLAVGVVLGAGAFVLTRVVPVLLGLELAVSQALLFPLIALFFVSVALSVVRYRIFDMPRWSGFLLFYFLGACLVLAMDALLVYVLAFDKQPSLALSLLVVSFAYLPFRDRVLRFITRRTQKKTDTSVSLLAMADYIARADTIEQMTQRWKNALTSLFDPLDITELTQDAHPTQATLVDFGRALELPSLARGIAELSLMLPDRGQRLFTSKDRAKAIEVMSLVAELQRGHAAYDSGIETERARIARDLHDNISIHLLGALHSNDAERKNVFVRETLDNLRQIVSGHVLAQTDLGNLISDLRFRIAETLTANEIALDWPIADLDGLEVSADIAHTINAITNEAITNVIRHSQAKHVTVNVAASKHAFSLTISDDGVGLDQISSNGNGLTNLRERVTQLGGTAVVTQGLEDKGLSWAFEIPLSS